MSAASLLPDTAVCLHCGYSLRGLPENICPECGSGFDPAAPMTFLDPPAGWTRRAHELAGPPSRLHILCMVALSLGVIMLALVHPRSFLGFLIGRSNEGPGAGAWVPMVMWLGPGIICGAGYISRLHVNLEMRRKGYVPATHLRSPAWLVWPVFMGLFISVSIYPWPFLLRFTASRPFLGRAVEVARTTGKPVQNQWVGLFYARRIVALGDGRIKVVTTETGFVYDPFCSDPPPDKYGLRLSRHWYVRDWR